MDDLPREMMEEILVRLQSKHVFRCKCVSKQLESVVSNPEFGQSYLQRARSSDKPLCSWHLWGMQHPYTPHRRLNEKDYEFVASSNGLVLCRFTRKADSSREVVHDFRVSNPLTRHAAKLPSLRFPAESKWGFGFATRHATYKVVILRGAQRTPIRNWIDHDKLSFTATIFSSDTGSWTCKELITCPIGVLSTEPPAETTAYSCKGILHWFDWDASMITYDPYNSPERFGRIPLPYTKPEEEEEDGVEIWDANLIHLGQEDVLKCAVMGRLSDTADTTLHVWRLVDYDKGEWRLEYSFVTALFNEFLRSTLFVVDAGDKLCCCLFSTNDDVVRGVDVASGEEVFAYPFMDKRNRYDWKSTVVFHRFCPWASPSYDADQAWPTWEWLGCGFRILHFCLRVHCLALMPMLYTILDPIITASSQDLLTRVAAGFIFLLVALLVVLAGDRLMHS